jgi:hypothetical protein
MLMQFWQVGIEVTVKDSDIVSEKRPAVDEEQAMEMAVLQRVHTESKHFRFLKRWRALLQHQSY